MTIIGAGMAGLSAALRLAERGVAVTLLDQHDFLGGKWGAHTRVVRTSRGEETVAHEHSYHMLLNWYHNFWDIVDELGLRDRFMPQPALRFLEAGGYPETTELRDVGSMETAWSNLFSGPVSPIDSFLHAYSLVDLLAEPLDPDRLLDRYSVNGFMASRPYATDVAALQHQRTLAKAFACPSYHTSARTYQAFVKYGYRLPQPMTWVLKGDVERHFHRHLERRLLDLGVDIQRLTRIERLRLDDAGRIVGLEGVRMARTAGEGERPVEFTVDGQVILAVPPGAVDSMVDEQVYAAAPELANVRKLRSEPMASLDLYFNRRLEGLPFGHVILLNSRYDLTFIDNAQVWPDEEFTVLNVVASDFDPLNFSGAAGDDAHRFQRLNDDIVMPAILQELRRYIPFEDADIDWAKTHLQTNTGESLFVNEVGTWHLRPQTRCGISNLFMAGDYVRSCIDVVTIEGAVLTGLWAAEAARGGEAARTGEWLGTPIVAKEPAAYPQQMLQMMKAVGAPYAYGAKMLSLGMKALGMGR
ncbi:MAG: FAD-dependent oxidoreductase [Pseudomonadota bacterium]